MMKCEEPVKILEMLTEKCHHQREIAASVGCAKTTVGEIQRRCRQAVLCYEGASSMTDEALKKFLYPAYTGRKHPLRLCCINAEDACVNRAPAHHSPKHVASMAAVG